MADFDPTLEQDRDWIRAQIADRNTDNPTLADETIDAIRAAAANKYLAAAECGSLIITKGGGLTEKRVDDLELTWGDKGAETAYALHIQRLREKGAQLLLPTQSNFFMLS